MTVCRQLICISFASVHPTYWTESIRITTAIQSLVTFIGPPEAAAATGGGQDIIVKGRRLLSLHPPLPLLGDNYQIFEQERVTTTSGRNQRYFIVFCHKISTYPVLRMQPHDAINCGLPVSKKDRLGTHNTCSAHKSPSADTQEERNSMRIVSMYQNHKSRILRGVPY